MQTLNKLLDRARKTCVRDSDNCLAEKMKVTRSAVSKWRHGGKIDDEQLLRLIEMAQADPGIWALVKTEQAKTAIEKKMFGALWDRLSPVTTVIGGLVLAVALVPGAARAKALEFQQFTAGEQVRSVYYVLLAWLSHLMRQHRMPPLQRRLLHA